MKENVPSLDEFIGDVEVFIELNEEGLEAVKDFWQHWSSFNSLIAQDSFAVHVDFFHLWNNFPQYKRYHPWKGGGMISLFLGLLSVWFSPSLGGLLIIFGIASYLRSKYIRSKDGKDFVENILKEAKLNPSNGGYVKLCLYYVTRCVKFVTPVGSACWPELPSNAITGKKSFVST